MNKDYIGVIIPVYNTKNYLYDCFESIRKQTYRNFKVFIIDDGSNDDSLVYSKEYSNKYHRFLVFSREHCGVSSCRNFGIKKCFEDNEVSMITFIDSDDTIEKDYLETLLKAKKQCNSKMSCCFIRRMGNNNIGTYDVKYFNKDETVKNYLEGKVIFESPCLKLADKDVYTNIIFNEDKKYEDTFTCYKIIENAKGVAYVDYLGYNNRPREGSATRSEYGNHSYDKVEACKEIYVFYKDTEFEFLAFNKYVGALLFFIIKTNHIRHKVRKNEDALLEFKQIIKENSLTKFKIKFIPFIFVSNIGLLKFIDERLMSLFVKE